MQRGMLGRVAERVLKAKLLGSTLLGCLSGRTLLSGTERKESMTGTKNANTSVVGMKEKDNAIRTRTDMKIPNGMMGTIYRMA